MTHDVKISLNKSEVLPDVFDWLLAQDLFHVKDWTFTKPDYFKDDWNYTFGFYVAEHATMFALRWA